MALRRLCVDGRDDRLGRGLFVLSALHLAAPGLGEVEIEVVNGQDIFVRTAVDILRWDCGVRIALVPEGRSPSWLEGESSLFVAVAVRSLEHLPLADLAAANVPTIIGIQFPLAGARPQPATTTDIAHNSRRLATRIVRELTLR